ncbi:MAG: NAD-dependent epimerase/dehydratase family protein [Anaerolineaceae bacterium]|nr:NAD-dependent epimerase/dehydratase family protein [Anaerolineaceae bacterium]
MTKILLAGATGVVGRLLLPMLVKAGHEVIGTTRSISKTGSIAAAGGHPLVLDVMDREATFTVLAQSKPDVVIHQLTDLAERDFTSNSQLRIEGVPNLVAAAKAVAVQKMIAQSISWIYAAGDKPAHEDEPLDIDASDSHGRAARAAQTAERSVMEIPHAIILRYGLLYGPGTWYARESFTSGQLQRGELTVNDAVASFLHVEDAAQAAFLALDWSAGIYNIVDDEPATKKEIFGLYARVIGTSLPPYETGKEKWERGESNAKARQLGWQPLYPTWREGFKSELT